MSFLAESHCFGHFLWGGGGGGLNPGERHSRVTRDDSTATLCTLCAATALSRNCCADCGRLLTKKVMLHSRDGPGVTAPLRTNIVPLTVVWNPPPPPPPPPPHHPPPLKSPRLSFFSLLIPCQLQRCSNPPLTSSWAWSQSCTSNHFGQASLRTPSLGGLDLYAVAFAAFSSQWRWRQQEVWPPPSFMLASDKAMAGQPFLCPNRKSESQ